jgi:hypothetical protein
VPRRLAVFPAGITRLPAAAIGAFTTIANPRLQLFGGREKWLSGGCEPNPAGRVYWRWSLRDKVIVQCNKETPWR